ncbi:reverse transcriptase [Senna tora]|uniref:Reverse transcriptase n=1 Tax=Senna tora TaxID=362788 RepID=A0A834TEX2_9FABA|nr:reverse transcriptase [Senna tora]
MTDSNLCPRCNKASESILHAIRDCPVVRPLWKALALDLIGALFLEPLVGTSGSKGMAGSSKAPKTMAYRLFPELMLSFWSPLDERWIKFNVDGSYKQNFSRSCGGVARNNRGDWLLGFSKKLCNLNSFYTEVWSIWIALKLAKERNFNKVIIESDFALTLDFVQQECENPHPLHGIVLKIRELLNQDWLVQFSFVHREGNRLANCLANNAHPSDYDLYLFSLPPLECIDVYQDDCRGRGSLVVLLTSLG